MRNGCAVSSRDDPLEFILTNPSIAHTAGIQSLTRYQNLLIAYLGHDRPERKRNTTDVKTMSRNEASLSRTIDCKTIPRNIDENRYGKIKINICKAFPN